MGNSSNLCWKVESNLQKKYQNPILYKIIAYWAAPEHFAVIYADLFGAGDEGLILVEFAVSWLVGLLTGLTDPFPEW